MQVIVVWKHNNNGTYVHVVLLVDVKRNVRATCLSCSMVQTQNPQLWLRLVEAPALLVAGASVKLMHLFGEWQTRCPDTAFYIDNKHPMNVFIVISEGLDT